MLMSIAALSVAGLSRLFNVNTGNTQIGVESLALASVILRSMLGMVLRILRVLSASVTLDYLCSTMITRLWYVFG